MQLDWSAAAQPKSRGHAAVHELRGAIYPYRMRTPHPPYPICRQAAQRALSNRRHHRGHRAAARLVMAMRQGEPAIRGASGSIGTICGDRTPTRRSGPSLACCAGLCCAGSSALLVDGTARKLQAALSVPLTALSVPLTASSVPFTALSVPVTALSASLKALSVPFTPHVSASPAKASHVFRSSLSWLAIRSRYPTEPRRIMQCGGAQRVAAADKPRRLG
jgi:hypothetical protein